MLLTLNHKIKSVFIIFPDALDFRKKIGIFGKSKKCEVEKEKFENICKVSFLLSGFEIFKLIKILRVKEK